MFRDLLQRVVKNLLPLGDEPRAKIIKPVIGAATIDDISRGPQIARVRFGHLLVKQSVKLDDFSLAKVPWSASCSNST